MFSSQGLFFLFREPRDILAVEGLSHVMDEEPVGALAGPAGDKV